MQTDIDKAILDHNSTDASEIAKDVSSKFSKFVPVSHVIKTLNKYRRSENVSRAKSQASETLDDKIALMESVGQNLLEKFLDESIPLKDRLQAATELRQWTKMSLDTAGIKDEDTNEVFVTDPKWDTYARQLN